MLAGGFTLLLQAADHSDSDGSVGIQSGNNKGLNLGSSVGSINNSQAVSSRSLLYSNFITAMNNNNHSSSVGELYHPQSQSTSLPPQPAKRTDSNASLGPPKKRIRNHHASLISLSSASTLGTWRGSYNSHIPNVSGGSNSSMSSPSMKKNEEWGTFKQDSPTVITSSGSTTAADVTADTTKDNMMRREKDIRQLFNMSLIVPKEKAKIAASQRVPSKNKSGNKKRRLSHSGKTKKKKELDCKDVNGNDICMGFFSMLSSQKSSTDEADSKSPPPQEDDSVTSSDKDQEQEEVVVPVPQSPKEEQEEASDSQVKKNEQEKDDTHTEAFKLSLRKAYLKALRERFGEE